MMCLRQVWFSVIVLADRKWPGASAGTQIIDVNDSLRWAHHVNTQGPNIATWETQTSRAWRPPPSLIKAVYVAWEGVFVGHSLVFVCTICVSSKSRSPSTCPCCFQWKMLLWLTSNTEICNLMLWFLGWRSPREASGKNYPLTVFSRHIKLAICKRVQAGDLIWCTPPPGLSIFMASLLVLEHPRASKNSGQV